MVVAEWRCGGVVTGRSALLRVAHRLLPVPIQQIHLDRWRRMPAQVPLLPLVLHGGHNRLHRLRLQLIAVLLLLPLFGDGVVVVIVGGDGGGGGDH